MTASIIIIVLSTLLFLYWFRYTCQLILSARTSQDFAADIARENELGFLHVQDTIGAAQKDQLDELQRSLARDYQVVSALLARNGMNSGEMGIEQTILRIDFLGMRALFEVARRVHVTAAKRALAEMCQVVAYMANTVGEQANGTAAA